MIGKILKALMVGLALHGNTMLPCPLTIKEICEAFDDNTPLGPL